MMGTLRDLSGLRFGRLLVVARAENVGRTVRWVCKCDCGAEAVVGGGNLVRGLSTSCGCSRVKHGMWTSKEYVAWRAMRYRCNYPAHPAYKNYGGRGITVCPEWSDFAVFLEDMGLAPEGGTLDRINNDGGYCKDNCRWATRKEQAINRRTTKLTKELRGMILLDNSPQKEAAKRFGVSQTTISRVRSRKQ